MRVLVTGGRDYANRDHVYAVLGRLHAAYPITMLIQGKSYGADMLADHWARAAGVPGEGYQAKWNRYQKRAGRIRNQKMLDESAPDLVVAFPGNNGTAHMVEIAEAAGVWVYRA